MLNHRLNDTIFAKEVLTRYDMKDNRLTHDVLRQALIRFVELTENYPDDEPEDKECPHCGEYTDE